MERFTSPTDSYTVVRPLSTHLFKQDFLCVSSQNSQKVVVHVIEVHPDSPAEPHKEMCKGIAKIENTHIPALIDSFDMSGHFCKVFAHVDAVPLSQHLRTRGPFAEESAKQVFLQLVETLEYLHERGIAHRNLTLDTVLINSSLKIQVVGWASATIRATIPQVVEKQTMTIFDPPEALEGKPSVGVYYDYWSLGVFLYCLLCARSPWTGETPREILYSMTCGTVMKPREMSVPVHNLMLGLIDFDSLRRFSPQMVKSHSWFSDDSKTRGLPKSISGQGSFDFYARARYKSRSLSCVQAKPDLTWGNS
jgi:serine/threonine protein kinase